MIEGGFQTDFQYTGRSDKPEYVWRKYESVLTESVLDVGADECGLRVWLADDTDYLGIGLSDHVDETVDLEAEGIPHDDNSFHSVVCLDVLEHLDNLHDIFDDICRVARRFVIISLPNPWAAFLGMLKNGYYDGPRRPIKWYCLPDKDPEDRHKWFYGAHEAEAFIEGRAERNGMKVVQMDRESSLSNPMKERFYRMVLEFLFHREVDVTSLLSGNVWALLEHPVSEDPAADRRVER